VSITRYTKARTHSFVTRFSFPTGCSSRSRTPSQRPATKRPISLNSPRSKSHSWHPKSRCLCPSHRGGQGDQVQLVLQRPPDPHPRALNAPDHCSLLPSRARRPGFHPFGGRGGLLFRGAHAHQAQCGGFRHRPSIERQPHAARPGARSSKGRPRPRAPIPNAQCPKRKRARGSLLLFLLSSFFFFFAAVRGSCALASALATSY
jgi:hypothetical protein